MQERGPGPLNGSKRSRDAEAQTAAKAARPPSPSRVSGWTGDAFVGKALLPRNAARRAELKESQGLESRASLQGFSQPGQTHPLSRSGLGKSTSFPKSPRGRRAPGKGRRSSWRGTRRAPASGPRPAPSPSQRMARLCPQPAPRPLEALRTGRTQPATPAARQTSPAWPALSDSPRSP